MLRLPSLLAFLFLALTACETANTTSDTTVDTDPQTVAPSLNEVEDTDDVVAGDNYEVRTIDGTIKSPRKELQGNINGVDITVNYGSPAVNQRTIYGELVPYNQVWRTGANEATKITFAEDVKVGADGKMLKAGTYALFTRPASREDWTIIFNKKHDQWGAYDYNERDDVASIKGNAAALSGNQERMDFALDTDEVILMWDDLRVSFPVAPAAR